MLTNSMLMLNQLNSYTGDNIWQDVIYTFDNLDQNKCCDGDGTFIYFNDDSVIRYEESQQIWLWDV